MAVLTYRLGSGLVPSDVWAALAETDQTAASLTAGWTVAKLAAGNACDWNVAANQTSVVFGTPASTYPQTMFAETVQHNMARTPNALTGTFAATAWTFTFAVRATTASAQAGRIRLKVWKSAVAHANVLDATELTSGAVTGTTSAALSTTADVTSVVTWSPGTFTLTGEYLFFAVAWEITTASGNNSGNVQFRTGQSAAGTRFVTADLGAAAVGKKPRVLSSRVAAFRAALR